MIKQIVCFFILLSGVLYATFVQAQQNKDGDVNPDIIRQALELDANSKKDQKDVPVLVTPGMSLEQIRKVKEQVLKYKQAFEAPIPVKGQRRVIALTHQPIEVYTAVHYSTVVEVPFKIRQENGVVVGDSSLFEVHVVQPNLVVLFPRASFKFTNVIIFPEDKNKLPVLLYINEKTAADAVIDYYLQIRQVKLEIDYDMLHEYMLYGKFSDDAVNELRKPECQSFPQYKTCKLSNPDYRLAIFKGDWDCLAGCDIEVEDLGIGLTGFAMPFGIEITICEHQEGRFESRQCITLK